MLLMSSCSATGAYDKVALGMSWASQCAQTPFELAESFSIALVVVLGACLISIGVGCADHSW